MPAFILVGLGVNPVRHLTREATDALRSSDSVFWESYTSIGPEGWLEFAEAEAGRSFDRLSREEVERGDAVLEAARAGTASLAVLGDPVFATTHSALLERSRGAAIETRVVPGISIHSLAVAATGLQSYKFGRVTTVPRWSRGFEPLSPLDPLKDNLSRGMHTLVLFDTGDGERPMDAIEGGKLLMEMARRDHPTAPLLDDETMVVMLERAGWDDEITSVCHLGEWDDVEFGPPPHAMVVPGALHVSETESLRRIVGGKFGGG
jgi:diphthine synthase